MKNRIFIDLEGIDGCGKSLLAKGVKSYFADQGWHIFQSKEPNEEDSLIGQAVKKMLRREMPKTDDPLEFQRLYVGDRFQDVVAKITPALVEPRAFYLIERFALSTLAFGMLNDIPFERLLKLHEEVIGTHMIWPDVTIVLDLPAEQAMLRLGDRCRTESCKPEFFERVDKLEKIRGSYLSLAQMRDRVPGNIIVVDASQSADVVLAECIKIIERELEK